MRHTLMALFVLLTTQVALAQSSFRLRPSRAITTTSIDVNWALMRGLWTYDLQYGTRPGVYGHTVSAIKAPYTLAGLEAKTRYHFRVIARNPGGNVTLYSNAMQARTAAATETKLVAANNDLDRAPAPFSVTGGTAVFVDFTEATYRIVYDVSLKAATVTSKITFNQTAAGRPVFDMVVDPVSVKLDGSTVNVELVSLPENASKVRMIDADVGAGEHTLEITSTITKLLEWDGTGVRSAFWTTDLNDRGYLEQYLPANLEFDRVPMTFDVEVRGAQKPQRIFANGVVTAKGDNKFVIAFPEYFTSSSLFFHTAPEGAFAELSFTFRSIDGRELPVVIYKKPGLWGNDTAALERLKTSTVTILNELESDYGPFLHPSVTIYNAGSGGMEYCGATMTDTGALGHELAHSYFARGIIPANGNAGWIDEALASWRDNNYPRASNISGTANMAGRPVYTRYTDYAAYSYGARFMSYLDGKFAGQGGLKSLLRKIVDEKAFTPFFTEDFIEWAEGHYRMDLKSEFKRVYGGKSEKQADLPHPLHQKMSIEEMQQFL